MQTIFTIIENHLNIVIVRFCKKVINNIIKIEKIIGMIRFFSMTKIFILIIKPPISVPAGMAATPKRIPFENGLISFFKFWG